ncbi:hypothetical protein [Brevibacillus sp. 7WMA2]|uniref:hypothetical protein n=1 Tax=Brevibacillus sp. 7WMA2 TaxID=2683193 RepID=UPI0020B16379|nr:hypothetical protein [Brevibacillus sp. 7WMA2]
MYNMIRKWTAMIWIITLCISILPGGEVIALEQTDQAIPSEPTTSQTLEQRGFYSLRRKRRPALILPL